MNPFWTAQRHGQDWRNDDVLRAIEWLTSGIDPARWAQRMQAVKDRFEEAKLCWASGNHTAELFDPKDLVAWYAFQANAFATDRNDWFEPEAYRISPIFRRLGQILPALMEVSGADVRALELMTNGRKQPDAGLFELLVAGAYKLRGWDRVAFVPEDRGGARTPDLRISRGRRHWSAECKRMSKSSYDSQERLLGATLARHVHNLCREQGTSLVLEVVFEVELRHVAPSYLAQKVEEFLHDPSVGRWNEPTSRGLIRPVHWDLVHGVLRRDDVFFGSSRMAELLAGAYDADYVHSVDGDWAPAPERPLHATSLQRASLVSWQSGSFDAAMQRAKHFRALVAKAVGQVQSDRPGVVHVGCESLGGNAVEALRHVVNSLEMRDFDPSPSRLRWVYGHYLSPEHTNHPRESDALSETTAPYKIGRHSTDEPLPHHLLFSEGRGRSGAHWA